MNTHDHELSCCLFQRLPLNQSLTFFINTGHTTKLYTVFIIFGFEIFTYDLSMVTFPLATGINGSWVLESKTSRFRTQAR